jgi:ADP-ribose pyrophosphatase YjhB (NUDIX family)
MMPSLQPFISNKKGTRRFACSAVALQAVVVNSEEQTLLLSSPARHPDGAWQVVSGALEARETVLAGTLREAHEELGSDILFRPLGTIHVQTFHYDENVQYMIAIYYLLAYQGGEICPGDDMQGSQYR